MSLLRTNGCPSQYIVAISPAIIVIGFVLAHALNKTKLLSILIAAITSILFGLLHAYKIGQHLATQINLHDLKATFTAIAKLNYPILFSYCLPILAGIIAMRYFIYKSRLSLAKADKNRNDKFGTGRIALVKEMQKANSLHGLPIGLIPVKDSFSSITKMGSGKGVGFIVSTLLEYQGAVLVLDPKNGKNYTIVKKRRLEMGRKVLVFDPFKITGDLGVTINIFDLLDPSSKDLFDDATTIANLICPVEQNESANAKHFQEGAGSLILYFILHVASSTLVQSDDRNLSYVYELLCLPSNKLEETLQAIVEEQVAFGGASAWPILFYL